MKVIVIFSILIILLKGHESPDCDQQVDGRYCHRGYSGSLGFTEISVLCQNNHVVIEDYCAHGCSQQCSHKYSIQCSQGYSEGFCTTPEYCEMKKPAFNINNECVQYVHYFVDNSITFNSINIFQKSRDFLFNGIECIFDPIPINNLL